MTDLQRISKMKQRLREQTQVIERLRAELGEERRRREATEENGSRWNVAARMGQP
jgi:sugar-specific transcriptional regulator TrmB